MPPVQIHGETRKLSKDSFDLLVQWYGLETPVTLEISVVGGPEGFEARTAVTNEQIGDVFDDIDGDLWIGAGWKPVLTPTEFGRLTLRAVSRSAKVGDLNIESGDRVIIEPSSALPPGTTGLGNLGNSCYMNSSLQCLAHIPELVAYFVTGLYRNDINTDNPIGHGGIIAENFGLLISNLYCEYVGAYSPYPFKAAVGRANRAFAGYVQQDSQEFTAFLLDALHEDLNKVVNKPATEKPELAAEKVKDQGAVADLAKRCWDIHRMRNNSVIQDLFTGLYRSTLICPVCNKTSVTFDPYCDLTLPLPSASVWIHKVTYVPLRGAAKSLEVALHPYDAIKDLKAQVAGLFDASADNLLAGDLCNGQVYAFFEDTDVVSDKISQYDELVVYEVTNEPDTFPVLVYTRVAHISGFPFVLCVGNESSSELRELLDEKFAQLTTSAREYSLAKWQGDGEVLQSTYHSMFYNLIDLDNPQAAPLATPEDEEDDDNSSVSALSGPASSPEESYLEVKSTGWTQARNDGPLLTPGDIVICNFGEEPIVADPEPLENPKAEAAKNRKQKSAKVSLDECLELFSAPEILGEQDLWYCGNCKEFRQATKQIQLWQAPDIFTVHLKRFSNLRSFRDKINDVVEFPIEGLDLTKWVQDASGQSLIYDLLAVDNHFGGLGGGHYTAYAKNYHDHKWYYFDDSMVSPADPEQAVTGAAYLLFYRRRSGAPLGGIHQATLDSASQVITEKRGESRRNKRRQATAAAANDRTSSPEEISSGLRDTPALKEDTADFDSEFEHLVAAEEI